MKLMLVLCCVAVTIMCVANTAYAEECTTNADCMGSTTTCAAGYHVICEHQGSNVVTNGGLCTCALNDLSCTTRADCLVEGLITCIDDGHKHCYDGKCICSRW